MSSARCEPEKAARVNLLLDTLSDNIRRELIHYFENFSRVDSASLETVISHIEERVPSLDEEELRQGLIHVHLPKLEERGWIAFDSRTRDIHYYGHERAQELLDELSDVFDD